MPTKICINCKEEKDLSKFSFRKDTNKYRNQCKECRKKFDHTNYMRKYRNKRMSNPEDKCRILAYTVKSTEKAIRKSLKIYGKRCQICGNSDTLVLQWHHRQRRGENMDSTCRRVAKYGDLLEDVMLLCSNCHIRQDIIDGTGRRLNRLARINDKFFSNSINWCNNEPICFDDLLIRPGYSELESRKSPNIYTHIGAHKIAPIIVANMSSIATQQMAISLAPLDIIVPFHRFQTIQHELEDIKACRIIGIPLSASIGLHDRERIEKMADNVCIFFLELAHAHSKQAAEEIKWIKKNFPHIDLVVGNIATLDAAKFLFDAGADVVKCGIGCGSVCETRQVTGCGVPQVSAIIECSEEGPTIADGGIRSSGDCIKALVFGARAVMIGSLFAGTDESVGHGRQRTYSGMASREAQVDRYGKLPDGIVPEGISVEVPYKGSAVNVAKDLLSGIRQGLAMVGAKNLKELREKAVIQKVSPSTREESFTHILNRV